VKVVHSRETSETHRIIMIAVDAENGQPDVHVRVGVVDVAIGVIAVPEIDVGIADKLYSDRPVAEDILAKDREAFFLSEP